jgi:hypothetical protein
MTGSLSHSLSVSTTFTLGRSTPNILQKFSTKTTNVPLTGMESATLTWIRTMMATGSMSQCLTMSPRPLRNSNTKHPTNHSINHTLTSNPTTEQRHCMRKTRTRHHCSPRKTKIHPGGHWHFLLLCTMCRQHFACGTGIYCYTTGKPD